LLLGDFYYVFFCSIVGMMALWELMRLEKKIPDSMRFFCYLWCAFLILYRYKEVDFYNAGNFSLIVCMFFFFSISIIVAGNLHKYDYKDSMWLLMVTMIVGIMFNSLVKVRFIGIEYTIYCFLVAILTDTFAYIGGRFLGKKKLSPTISPNKTIAGSIIGSIFGTIFASIYYYFAIGNIEIESLILLSFALTILCQCGDLFFSSIKRYYNVKDYSDLIPGHGGILDRLDSSLFVILGFLLYNIFM